MGNCGIRRKAMASIASTARRWGAAATAARRWRASPLPLRHPQGKLADAAATRPAKLWADHEAGLHDPAPVEAMLAIALFILFI